ncbi:phosphinothricin acetyltransferase [Modestobacter sp. DSM 44400]|uniref:GNAT family N-acetyltransferase n=1 Tax=Modestobacter sp. DSM 44400 TaxID=1550230 RepID=UPI0008965EEA|nr:GNAT family N-acetyltransferase [Modestobacter sp. DSM 44400]SDY35177.1 phosphinothricin acetyltransferase [Modestobacter sp. DSM 44400]
MTGVGLRPFTPDDAEAVSRIYAHHVEHSVATFDTVAPGPADWGTKAAGITSAGWPFLVATEGGEVIGFAYVSPWRVRPAYAATVEDTVYLAPGRSGRGAGRALLTAVLDRAAQAGAEQAIATIADSGDPSSLALHRALGFTEVGRLRAVGRKHGRLLDVVLVQASLGSD